jgi:hypothetical protein
VTLFVSVIEGLVFIALVVVAAAAIGGLYFVFLKADDQRSGDPTREMERPGA